MRPLVLIPFFTIATLLLSGCGETATFEPAAKPPAVAKASVTLDIEGMHCDGCASKVAATLKESPGVASASCTFADKQAVIAYDPEQVETEQLLATVKDLGYKVNIAPMATPAPAADAMTATD